MKTRNFPAKKLARQIRAEIRRRWKSAFPDEYLSMATPGFGADDETALIEARNKRTKKHRP